MPSPERKILKLDGPTLLSAGSIFAALGASTCCVVPLVALSLGIGGAWLGNVNALYPYKPYLIGTALVLLAARYIKIYRRRQSCCQKGRVRQSAFLARFDKAALWVSTVLIILAIGLPYAAPAVLGGL